MNIPRCYHDLIWILQGTASYLGHKKRTDLAATLYDLAFMITCDDPFTRLAPPLIYQKAAYLQEEAVCNHAEVINTTELERLVWDLNSAMLSDDSIVHNKVYDMRIKLRNALPAEMQKYMTPRLFQYEDGFKLVTPKEYKEYKQSILDALVGTNYAPMFIKMFKEGLSYNDGLSQMKLQAARRLIMLGYYEDGAMLIYSTTPSYREGLCLSRYT